jgi:hypothetical protein
MNVVDRGKYVSSILIAFAMGVMLNLALEQHLWHGATSLAGLWHAIKGLHVDKTGLSQIWPFVASGGTFAGIYVWLFEKYFWKWPLFQGWFVRFHNLNGTWLGILEPRTKPMQPGISAESGTSLKTDRPIESADSSIPEWARNKRVLPVRVMIEHDFDQLTFTAVHPNSMNTTLAQQLVYVNTSKETRLYVVYSNKPNNPTEANAAAHEGCCELNLINAEGMGSATSKWLLLGKYWTDKPRGGSTNDDRGTWGNFSVWWESREKKDIAWEEETKFDRRSGAHLSQAAKRNDSSATAPN